MNLYGNSFWDTIVGKSIRWITFLPIWMTVDAILFKIPELLFKWWSSMEFSLNWTNIFLFDLLAGLFWGIGIVMFFAWLFCVAGIAFWVCFNYAPNHKISSSIIGIWCIIAAIGYLFSGENISLGIRIYSEVFLIVTLIGALMAFKQSKVDVNITKNLTKVEAISDGVSK